MDIDDSVDISTVDPQLYESGSGLDRVPTTVDETSRTVTANVTSLSGQTFLPGNNESLDAKTKTTLEESWPQFDDLTGSGWTLAGEAEFKSDGGNGSLVVDHNESITSAGSWARRGLDLQSKSLERAYVTMRVSTAADDGYAYVYVINQTAPVYKQPHNLGANKLREMKVPVCGNTCTTAKGPAVVRINVTKFIGEQVTIKAVATGDGKVTMDWVRVERHSDLDGLSDAVENEASDLQGKVLTNNGQNEKLKKLGLDPTSIDTDGDGLWDNNEVALSCCRFGNTPTPDRTIELERYTAHPSRVYTDDVGLNDAEEVLDDEDNQTSAFSSSSSSSARISTDSSSIFGNNCGSDPVENEEITYGYSVPVYKTANDDQPASPEQLIDNTNARNDGNAVSGNSMVLVPKSYTKLTDDSLHANVPARLAVKVNMHARHHFDCRNENWGDVKYSLTGGNAARGLTIKAGKTENNIILGHNTGADRAARTSGVIKVKLKNDDCNVRRSWFEDLLPDWGYSTEEICTIENHVAGRLVDGPTVTTNLNNLDGTEFAERDATQSTSYAIEGGSSLGQATENTVKNVDKAIGKIDQHDLYKRAKTIGGVVLIGSEFKDADSIEKPGDVDAVVIIAEKAGDAEAIERDSSYVFISYNLRL
jgi:hypothetical protein